jgi:hypothetical protein
MQLQLIVSLHFIDKHWSHQLLLVRLGLDDLGLSIIKVALLLYWMEHRSLYLLRGLLQILLSCSCWLDHPFRLLLISIWWLLSMLMSITSSDVLLHGDLGLDYSHWWRSSSLSWACSLDEHTLSGCPAI